MRFKLTNILLEVDDFLQEHPELILHADEPHTYDVEKNELTFSGTVDFLTYFNALSLSKWRRYTNITNLHLHLELNGDTCTANINRAYAQDGYTRVNQDIARQLSPQDKTLLEDIELDLDDAILIGFTLTSEGTTSLSNAYFYTEIDESVIKLVNIALCTTTFTKEEYIVPNIAAIKQKVLSIDEPVASNFHMFVIDNGRTLDVEALSDSGVSIHPNPNVGGAGGFARGMMEALDSSKEFTHVLLMDDDVRMSPESFIRTYNLLALRNDSYQDAFINGAMLQLQNPNIMFEDVSYVRKSGGYEGIKPSLDVAISADLVRNETIDVEVEGAYGAWWYSCIPVSAIKKHGLPVPLFVRCDDVEFGIRCKPTYMTMAGICVWHSQFAGRFRASVDGYQYVRNFLILNAIHSYSSEPAFMARYWRIFQIWVRMMNYESAELWLDGLEDYLKGPEFIKKVDGAQIMKDKGAKNEKLVPIDELDSSIMSQVTINQNWLGQPDGDRSFLQKALESVPHDRHMFPDWVLIDEPEIIDYTRSFTPWQKTALRKTLVALNSDGTEGHIRRLDRKRYRELTTRYNALRREYRERHEEIEQQWKEEFPIVTSKEFWLKYLKERS